MKILVAGELNPDLILGGCASLPELGQEVLVRDARLTLGSASAICAAGLARLGDEVAFFGKAGCDPWGDFCCDQLARYSVDVSHIIREPEAQTGLTVSLTFARDRALMTHLGAIAELRADEVELLPGFQHLHVSSFFLQQSLRPGCIHLFAEAQRRGLTTSLDPGCDPAGLWNGDLHDTLAHVDVFLPNETELEHVSGVAGPSEGLRRMENGRTLTVVKLGSRGCMALEKGELIHTPAFPVDPVDTTGAGDLFNAGFLHAWLLGRPLRDAMQYATICGALSTLGLGGTGAQPTDEEVSSHLGALEWR